MRAIGKLIPRFYSSLRLPRQSTCFLAIHEDGGKFLSPHLPCSTVLGNATLFNRAFKEPPSHDPEKGDLVYVGSQTNFVKFVKVMSVSSSGLGLLVQPLVYDSFTALPAVLQVMIGGCLGMFIVLTPLLLHWMTKRYITSMYYNEQCQVFTAHTLSFFVQRKTKTFTAEDVHIPDITGLFTTLKAKGDPLFFDPNMFLQKDVFRKLMGLDKPIDLSDFFHDKNKEKEM